MLFEHKLRCFIFASFTICNMNCWIGYVPAALASEVLSDETHISDKYADNLSETVTKKKILKDAISKMEQSDFKGAEQKFLEILSIDLKRFGEGSAEVSTDNNNLAIVYTEMFNYSRAEELFRKSLGTKENLFGVNSPKLIPVLDSLGVVYIRTGRYSDANKVYQRALLLFPDKNAVSDPQLLAHLAELKSEQGFYKESIALLEKAIGVQEKVADSDPLLLADMQQSLANQLAEFGDNNLAEKFYSRVLETRLSLLGLEHPSVASVQVDRGFLLLSERKTAAARQLFERALAQQIKTFGPTNLTVAKTLSGLADVEKLNGNFVEARKLISKVIAIRSHTLGDKHRETITALRKSASIEFLAKNMPLAEKLYNQVLEADKETIGITHPDYAKDLVDKAKLLMSKGATIKARALCLEAISILEKRLSPSDACLEQARDLVAKLGAKSAPSVKHSNSVPFQ
ncbi:MAG: hypothetical protein QG574_728 [Cyanobacteriota bacterium erpe_2018_sw_21hr_WHONDRS-SW48-000092_B_bin.40]|nr:hypothetical protein [Cyanobacteriota bacterium erpe_2018_sw_21hr_WHONDRS-SW48-000092_B_bin.40]